MSYITLTDRQHHRLLRILTRIASGGAYESDDDAQADLEEIADALGYGEILVRKSI